MGFEKLNEAFDKMDEHFKNQDTSADDQTTTTQDDSAEGGHSAAPEAEDNEQISAQGDKSNTPPSLVDLDQVERVKWKGKEWTREELDRATLMQSDYTRKTQALAEDRKYYDNLAHDLRNVAENPDLAAEFRKIYPKQFHSYLDVVLRNTQQTEAEDSQVETPTKSPSLHSELDPIKQQLDELRAEREEERISSFMSQLDANFERLAPKYEFADPNLVLSRLEAFKAQGGQVKTKDGKVDAAVIEKMFKAEHERMKKVFDERYIKHIEEQKRAAAKNSDIGAGGGTPGQAPKKMSLKEASQAAISHYSSSK